MIMNNVSSLGKRRDWLEFSAVFFHRFSQLENKRKHLHDSAGRSVSQSAGQSVSRSAGQSLCWVSGGYGVERHPLLSHLPLTSSL